MTAPKRTKVVASQESEINQRTTAGRRGIFCTPQNAFLSACNRNRVKISLSMRLFSSQETLLSNQISPNYMMSFSSVSFLLDLLAVHMFLLL